MSALPLEAHVVTDVLLETDFLVLGVLVGLALILADDWLVIPPVIESGCAVELEFEVASAGGEREQENEG